MGLLSRPTDQQEALASAVERAWCGAWAALACDGVTQVDDTPQYLRVLTPHSSDMLLNAILRFQQERPVTHADVELAIAPYRAVRRPMQWWLRSGAEPRNLRQELFAMGMQPWGHPKGMALPLDRWQPPHPLSPDISIARVTTTVAAQTTLQTICTVFGLAPQPMRHWGAENPRFTAFQATVHGTPAGALVRLIEGDVVGFFHVATLPRFRRRGIAAAMMTHALLDARMQGARIAALTASPMAETLYQRLGFVPCCSFELWMPTPRLLSDLNGFG